ncbi:MAG: NAD(P)/FAD-dependent oxidoreductase [Lawsonibacter sp.]
METYDLLVIGGGAAGMAAALSAEAAGVPRILLVERAGQLGGVLPQCIHRGFGRGQFGADLTGPEYADRFIRRTMQSNVHVRTGTTVLQLKQDKTALLSSGTGLTRVSFARCILASGCRERPVGSLPVWGTRPAGIFTAGAAQKMVNLAHYHLGNAVVILGSGDIGQIMARQFVQSGIRVVAVVEQKAALGGMARNQRECIQAYGIPVILRATIDEILGSGRISGVMVRHLDTGDTQRLDCDTLVTALGLIPERELIDPLWQSGRLPDWISLCGNCDHIYDIVDSITAQAEKLGAACRQGAST